MKYFGEGFFYVIYLTMYINGEGSPLTVVMIINSFNIYVLSKLLKVGIDMYKYVYIRFCTTRKQLYFYNNNKFNKQQFCLLLE